MKDVSSIQQLNLIANIPEGKKLKVSIDDEDPTPTTRPAFMQVGNGLGSKKKGRHSMNYTKMLLGLSKPAGFLFDLIMDGRLPYVDSITGVVSLVQFHNVAITQTKGLTSSERNYITAGYKELVEKDMVIRQKRGRYVINPRLVISGDKWADEEVLYKELTVVKPSSV